MHFPGERPGAKGESIDMKTPIIACAVLALVALTITGYAEPKDGKKDGHKSGLVAHYFKDPTNWDGNWPDGVSVPKVNPVDWTFTQYAYSRVEPLVNHLFINEGWFTIRWVGYLDTAALRKTGKAPEDDTLVFSVWADDGCRLFIDGEELIDDWRACAEDSAGARRVAAPIKLSTGKHRIVIEYFQGQSLKKKDKDPIKIYWSSQTADIPRQVIPSAAFMHTEDDLKSLKR